MKCIFKKLKNQHYLFSMTKDVMKVISKVNDGTENSIFMYFIYLKENRTKQMKDIKDVLLYLDSFDEDNMYDFDHDKKLQDVPEVLRYEMNRRAVKYNLNYSEDAILDLIDLTV